MENKIVANNGSFKWTWKEVGDLFGKVANKENWKYPIDAFVTFDNDKELLGMREAIPFYTGSVATIEATNNLRDGKMVYRVRAAGYYAAIGA